MTTISRTTRARLAVGLAVACAVAVVLAGQPALASHTVAAAGGSAFNYATDVSLFGGPSERRGFGQAEDAPETAASPSVACPEGGGTDTATDEDGARAQYGPAVIFGGLWPEENTAAPPSGPLTSSIDCQLGEGGYVTATTSLTLQAPGTTWTTPGGSTQAHPGGIGPGPLTADEVHSSCTATAEGQQSIEVEFTSGEVVTETDPDTQLPVATEPVPANPEPGYQVEGTIDHVGDSFRITFNEQTENPDGSVTVNAARMELFGPTAVGEMVVGSVTCGPLEVELGPNEAPVAVDDSFQTAVDTALDVAAPGVLGNDTDHEGGQLVAEVDTAPSDGTLELAGDGSFTYTPDGGFTGTDTFTYSATDEAEASDTATVTITVGGPEPSPSPSPDPDPAACPAEEVSPASFSDRGAIPEAHRGNVDCAAWREIVTGFADGSYGPGMPVRRDQMASFIARTLEAAGVDLPAPAAQRFSDVDTGSVHDEAVHRLAAAGIVQGGPGGLPASAYGPGLVVRRDQMASFLVRAAEFATEQVLASEEQAFSDVPASNPHFANVNGASEAGLAQGVGQGSYRPGDEVRRDQMATFVIRLLGLLLEDQP